VINRYSLTQAIYRYLIGFDSYIEILDRSEGELEIYSITLDEDGDIDYTIPRTETDIEYWIGHVLWWYHVNDDNFGWWNKHDVFRAAQACMICGEVLDAEVLIYVCGIQREFSEHPLPYNEMKIRLDLKNEADFNNRKFCEGAD
tara:strand:- start:10125 stop:10556 length:432 start_codon:yes stop_codon:yes gene_type:complete